MEPTTPDEVTPPEFQRRQTAEPSQVRRRVVIVGACVLGGLLMLGILSIFQDPKSRDARAAPPPKTDAVSITRDILDWKPAKPALPAHEAPPPPERVLPPAPEAPQQASSSPAKLSERDAAAKEARTAPILVAQSVPKAQDEERRERPAVLRDVPIAEAAQAPTGSAQERFLARVSGRQDFTVQGGLESPVSPWVVQAPTTIPAALVGGINSDLPGYLYAKVVAPVYAAYPNHYTILIPQGAELMGEYDAAIVYGQSRILVVWTRLKFPNSKTIPLEGMAGVDLSGLAGLKGRVNNHWWDLTKAVLLSSVLSVGVRVPFGSPSGQNQYQNLAQEFSQDFGAGINQAGQRIVARELSRKPTIDDITPGKAFLVFVHKDLVLEPYQPVVARQR